MEFFEVISRRQSVRKYTPQEVEEHKLAKVLDAANGSPSAGNFQSYEIYVVRGEQQGKALAAATFEQDFVAEGPLSLVFCMNPARCEYKPPEVYAMQDASIACTVAMLTATALGLASCWVGALNAEKTAAVIGCKSGVVPVAILSIGYANETPERTTRRAIGDLVHFVG